MDGWMLASPSESGCRRVEISRHYTYILRPSSVPASSCFWRHWAHQEIIRGAAQYCWVNIILLMAFCYTVNATVRSKCTAEVDFSQNRLKIGEIFQYSTELTTQNGIFLKISQMYYTGWSGLKIFRENIHGPISVYISIYLIFCVHLYS